MPGTVSDGDHAIDSADVVAIEAAGDQQLLIWCRCFEGGIVLTFKSKNKRDAFVLALIAKMPVSP